MFQPPVQGADECQLDAIQLGSSRKSPSSLHRFLPHCGETHLSKAEDTRRRRNMPWSLLKSTLDPYRIETHFARFLSCQFCIETCGTCQGRSQEFVSEGDKTGWESGGRKTPSGVQE